MAKSRVVSPLAAPFPSRWPCNSDLARMADPGVVPQTLLVPCFAPILPPSPFVALPVSAMEVNVQTLLAASTIGVAIYEISYSGAATLTATLRAQLNANLSGAAAGVVRGDVTTGAAGSGASIATLDFAQKQYVYGVITSTATTLAIAGQTINKSGLGLLRWTAAARSSTTDWPASFTQTSVAAANAGYRALACNLVTADGKLWF